MLDDLKMIHERDAQDALGIAEKQWQQLQLTFELPPLDQQIDNVVHAGMGGSALWALVSQSWPGYRVPFELCRDYDIPTYVSEKTLFIASSYSGNTEETLAALEQAEAKQATIAVITGGGKLAEIAKQKGYPLALLPKFEQPRFALLAGFKALVTLLEQAGLLAAEAAEQTIQQAGNFLETAINAWKPGTPTSQNPAKQLAQELMGKAPVVYAGPKLFPAAYKWKISFNENAKNIAWCNELPEFNHNEFNGWVSHPVDKPYAVVDLRSNLEHPRVQKRFEVTERLLSGKRPRTHVVQAEGGTLLEQLLWTITYGDFVSLYLALLNGLNPTPVEYVEKFKKALDA
jgi:glucose/mannose-6-phosphate isomerase